MIIQLFFGVLLIASVSSTIPQAAVNPVCPTPGNLGLSVDATEKKDQIEFDAAGTYLDKSTYDSVRLFVKNGDSTNNFKFITYNDDFSTPTIRECQQTSTFTFIALVSQILVVKNPSNSKHYACKFDPNVEGAVARAQLDAPANLGTPTKFMPYYYEHQLKRLYIAINNGVGGGLCMFYLGVQFVTETTTITGVLEGALFRSPFTQIYGNGAFFYDTKNYAIYYRYQNGLLSDKSADFPVAAGNVVRFSPMTSNLFCLAVLASDQLSGTVYFINPSHYQNSSPVDIVTLPVSSTPFQSRSDNLNNFVMVGEGFFYWANVDNAALGTPRSISLIDVIDTSLMIDLGASGNKVVIFYDNRIDYYRMTSSGIQAAVVELIFSKKFTASISADGQYKFVLSCMCGGLQQVTCYSSTLNCLIIKVAGIACGIKDNIIVASD